MMKRAAVLLLAVATTSVIAAACSGGGKSKHGSGDLASGEYVVSNAQTASDGCAANGFLPDGAVVPIARSSTSDAITMLGVSGTIVAGVLHDVTLTLPYDWAGNSSFDCHESDTYIFEGATTTSNAADLVFKQQWEYVSGTECAQAYAQYSTAVGQTVTLPCSSALKLHIERSGPLPTPTPTHPPITGILDTASGFAAYLTTSDSTLAGSMSYHATIDVPLTLSSALLFCLAPDLAAGFANFDLVSGNGSDNGFDLSITPAAWNVGSVAIGTSNTLTFFQIDGFGVERDLTATAGTAMLFTAPTVIGDTSQSCQFGLQNVPVAGSLVPAMLQSHRTVLTLHHPTPQEVRRQKRLQQLRR